MQHAWKHVERPGGSHTALDGKKLSIAQPDDEPSCLSNPTTPHDPQKDLENAIETPIPDDTIS